jgi:TAG lipase/steryl ester hydrolase/phospholipase A2/LPA acyltransferase
MGEATTFETWSLAATRLDALDGLDPRDAAARWARETSLYDRRLLTARTAHLRAVRACGDVPEMAFALRTDLLRNLGNMAAPALHEHFHVVPEPIREYIDEVKLHLAAITAAALAPDGPPNADNGGPPLPPPATGGGGGGGPSPGGAHPTMPLEEALNFLRETRHAFGRTALVLSGGGALGAFHVGVIKALLAQGLLPRVLAGSSAGAIVAAAIATRNDAELTEMFAHAEGFDLTFFANSTAGQFARHLLLKGTLQDAEVLQKRLRRLLGDATFSQAFQHSGRVLNVAVTAADTNEPPRVLNYLTAPHVVVWSAVSCSSAFPLLFLPQDLLARNARGELVPFAPADGGNGGCGRGSGGSASSQPASPSASTGPASPFAVTASGPPGGLLAAERRWRDGSLEEDLPMKCLAEMFNVNYFLVSQTNPHIVPFLHAKRLVGPRVGGVLEAEWKHRCRQVVACWPSLRWLKVLSQPWEGDVTMVLPISLAKVVTAITNLSAADLASSAREGERATWAKLSAIAANCGIEQTLDACMLKLSGAAATRKAASARAGARARSLRSRIPSWVSFSAVGMPHVPSDDNLQGSGGMDGGGGGGGGGGGLAMMGGGGLGSGALAAVAEAADEGARTPRHGGGGSSDGSSSRVGEPDGDGGGHAAALRRGGLSPASPLSPGAPGAGGGGAGSGGGGGGRRGLPPAATTSRRAAATTTPPGANGGPPHHHHHNHSLSRSHSPAPSTSTGRDSLDLGAFSKFRPPAPAATPAEAAFAAACLPFDCCDRSVTSDIWGGAVMPPGAGAAGVGDGLDVVAP